MQLHCLPTGLLQTAEVQVRGERLCLVAVHLAPECGSSRRGSRHERSIGPRAEISGANEMNRWASFTARLDRSRHWRWSDPGPCKRNRRIATGHEGDLNLGAGWHSGPETRAVYCDRGAFTLLPISTFEMDAPVVYAAVPENDAPRSVIVN